VVAAFEEATSRVHDEPGVEFYALHEGRDRLVMIEKYESELQVRCWGDQSSDRVVHWRHTVRSDQAGRRHRTRGGPYLREGGCERPSRVYDRWQQAVVLRPRGRSPTPESCPVNPTPVWRADGRGLLTEHTGAVAFKVLVAGDGEVASYRLALDPEQPCPLGESWLIATRGDRVRAAAGRESYHCVTRGE
jgi:hypothetical protein